MAPTPRAKTTKTVARTTSKPRPIVSTFARLQAQAAEESPGLKPYIIDDVDPPIVLWPPTDTERQFEIVELFADRDPTDQFRPSDAQTLLRLLAGDEFPRVWELVRKADIRATLALIEEMGTHFEAQVRDLVPDEDEVADVPGGAGASSS